MANQDYQYCHITINVYNDDRDFAKKAKQDGESWSEFIRRAGERLSGE